MTGLVDVTYTLTLTSHWKSLAILDSLEGILKSQPRDNNHVVIRNFKHKIRQFPDKITGVTVSVCK